MGSGVSSEHVGTEAWFVGGGIFQFLFLVLQAVEAEHVQAEHKSSVTVGLPTTGTVHFLVRVNRSNR